MLAIRLRIWAPQLRAMYVCVHIYARLDRFSARTHPFTIEHIYAYTHMKLCHIHVITMSYLKCGYVLMGCYVSTKIDMKSQEKKLDITSALYVAIMIVVFILAV